MEALEVLRAVLGLAVVLFFPGFALTMALWPRSKKEVALEVMGELKKRKIEEASIIGNEEEAEDLIPALRENAINVDINPEKPRKACILVGNLEEQGIPVPEAEFLIDLGSNSAKAVKVEDTIDGIERAALSFGLSVALVPLLGIILDKTPYGIRLGSILASLILVIFLFLAVYYYRRKSLAMHPWPSF
jgi:hypothetical protein